MPVAIPTRRLLGQYNASMSSVSRVLIFGASARAAAFSALRAGLEPWCVDLFADRDLNGRCAAMRLPGDYPASFADIERTCPPGPWLYTGGLENHPMLVMELAARRPLWGNDGPILRRVRHPAFLRDVAGDCGLPVPELAQPGRATPGRRYLLKHLSSAGGRGVAVWSGELDGVVWGQQYLQEYIEGVPASALYVAAGGVAVLLGLTRQLIGEPWLNASGFAYCGNVGPLPLDASLSRPLRRLGQQLAAAGGLRGLFGVDGILRDGAFWPIEINPRYTASLEVLEYATGLRGLDLHQRAFTDEESALQEAIPTEADGVVGKAILFAAADLDFPADGSWMDTLRQPSPVEQMPAFADLPAPGDHLKQGSPVFTLLERGATVEECVARLQRRVAEVSAALGWAVAGG